MPSKSEARAVLTAAGSGSRLGCEGPKALVELSGRPLVWWAARGLRAGGVGAIIVTAPASSIEEFRSALSDINDLTVVAGSDRSRQESVALGLAALGRCEADTDDAGLVEAIGGIVHTVAGDERSMKVTRPLDLALARLLADQEQAD